MCYERRDPNVARACWEKDQRGKKVAEYIESAKMADVVHRYFVGYKVEDMIRDIRKEAIADVAPVVHGRWVQVICHVEFGDGFVDRLYECCSRCHKPNGRKTSDYCPNCGARMDGE